MNKKIYIILALTFTLSMTIAIISVTNNGQKKVENLGTSVAIMVYDETVNDYVKADTIPKGNYKLNENKTNCIAGGSISNYDAKTGNVKYNFVTSDECYMYFDKATELEVLNVELLQGAIGNFIYDSASEFLQVKTTIRNNTDSVIRIGRELVDNTNNVSFTSYYSKATEIEPYSEMTVDFGFQMWYYGYENRIFSPILQIYQCPNDYTCVIFDEFILPEVTIINLNAVPPICDNPDDTNCVPVAEDACVDPDDPYCDAPPIDIPDEEIPPL